ncbi:30S ribosome-binding factor RbfA [Atopomonas sediminilitoris]|uniref:30S ribosome-binding factor RbfA n=1 Tax=Atopomonas sediminilitoris TaxID=2919919 RepID=UPI001F4DDBEE|nr:30S ribosome-binding factor RbfA [Atopomonas sediminilitoris]MCJ8170723.1 30S ribosome-binding factor RbfA [Atopomonas sediminilitoris]
MAKEYSRTQRVGDQMQRELAVLISREMKDPRVSLVTVSAVEVSRDLAYAQVYVTAMASETPEQMQEILTVLKGAAGFLRTQLGRVMKLRHVPQLNFRYDESIARGAHLSALIERAVSEDRQHDSDEDKA